jgi:hypothetical protein
MMMVLPRSFLSQASTTCAPSLVRPHTHTHTHTHTQTLSYARLTPRSPLTSFPLHWAYFFLFSRRAAFSDAVEAALLAAGISADSSLTVDASLVGGCPHSRRSRGANDDATNNDDTVEDTKDENNDDEVDDWVPWSESPTNAPTFAPSSAPTFAPTTAPTSSPTPTPLCSVSVSRLCPL